MLKIVIGDNCLIQGTEVCNNPPIYFLFGPCCLIMQLGPFLFSLQALFSSYDALTYPYFHAISLHLYFPIFLCLGVIFQRPKALLFDWHNSVENTVSFSAVDGPQGFSIAQGHSHYWGRRMLLLLSLLYPPRKTTDLQPWYVSTGLMSLQNTKPKVCWADCIVRLQYNYKKGTYENVNRLKSIGRQFDILPVENSSVTT